MEQRVPRGLASVKAKATIRFKQRRRRDEGNFRALLEKALGDVLQAGGYLTDDTPDSLASVQSSYLPRLRGRRRLWSWTT